MYPLSSLWHSWKNIETNLQKKLWGFLGKQRSLGMKLFLWLAFLYDLYIPFFSLQVSVDYHPPARLLRYFNFTLTSPYKKSLSMHLVDTSIILNLPIRTFFFLQLYHIFGSTNQQLKLMALPIFNSLFGWMEKVKRENIYFPDAQP